MTSTRERLAVAITAAVVLGSVAAPPATAKKKDPAHGGRGCSMLSSFVDSPEPFVAPYVPDRFTTRQGFYPGHVGLVVNTMKCEDLTVNGKSFGPGALSVFWVFVEAPDGSGGDHLYEAWRLTDNPKVAAALARHGVRLQAAGVTLDTQPPTPAGTVTTSEVTWDGGSSYSAAGVEPAADPTTYVTQPYAYTLWQLNEGRLVKMPVFENFEEPSNWTEVEGYFAAEPGSDFALMIGAAQPTNHALFTDYEFEIEIGRS